MHTERCAPPRARVQRQPSQRRRRAGVLASALAAAALAGTVTAAPAHAFSREVGTMWNRVAECESSQRWHLNTGNGYYGGLQFSKSTWVDYHGRKYAWRADKATRAQQIEVARRVLYYQGRGAWPYCGAWAGLTRSTGGATNTALPNI